MKSRILVLIDAISVLAALAMPVRLAAQQYTVTNLGTVSFPAETYRRNWEMYLASKARTDFVLFPNLTHFSIAEPGHEALAAYCAAWADARFRERGTGSPAGTSREPGKFTPLSACKANPCQGDVRFFRNCRV